MSDSSPSIKAIGDWTLDILAAPFGSPARKDAHGEYFDMATDFAADHYPLAPIVYYHGYIPAPGLAKQATKPVFIGRSVSREVRVDGVWYKAELDPTKPEAQTVMKAAREGKAAASPGTADHLRRVAPDGHCDFWAIVEVSAFDMYAGQRPANPYAVALPALKAVYEEAGIDSAILEEESPMPPTPVDTQVAANGVDIQALVNSAIKAALDEQAAAHHAAQTAAQERQAEIDKAVKAATDALVADWAIKMRLPDGSLGAPIVAQFAELRTFDHIDAADTAVLVSVLAAAHESRATKKAPSEAAYKALAIKLEGDQTRVGEVGRSAMKALNIKANEVMQSTLTGFGDEWVGVAYSQAIWDRIRLESFVAGNLPSVEVPQGAESITLPLEGADPQFYKVAEATGTDSATGWRPAATITSSQAATGSRSLTLAKMGARVLWTGELEEGSLIPFVPQLRSQLSTAGMEQFEHAIIDGDITTTGSTNINDIGNASTQTATNLHLLFDGFRKLALITTTTNARDGGALALSDYLETVKLMGVSGINALGLNRKKVGFIVDPLTYYATMQLTQVLTRDVFSNPTIENGELTGLFGYALRPSGQICRLSGNGLSNTAGKVDQTTPSNNTKGQILAVRWDQWMLGYRRRMTTEVTRIPRADSTEIVCMMRVGLKSRDGEASAISYNLTV